MLWEQLLSDRRLGASASSRPASRSIARSDFERDYDRLVFSPPFRRLQNKTQVFPLPGTVFVHNRLTHSLEVSCLGRSLGSLVGDCLAERHPEARAVPLRSGLSAIVSAASLAHDMGNPPFGHSGERAISAYFTEGAGRRLEDQVRAEGGRWEDFVHFEGNANTFRLLTHQFRGRREGGFALTYSTLASTVKYPYSSEQAGTKGKFGFFQSEEETMREVAGTLGLIQRSTAPLSYVRHPLVFLVEAADDICYQIMDIEDASKLHLLPYSEATALLEAFFTEEELRDVHAVCRTIGDDNERLGYLRSKVINLLVEECAAAFLDCEGALLAGTLTQPLIQLTSPHTRRAYEACSEVARARIYRAREVVDVELAGHRIFSALLDELIKAMEQPDHLYSRTLLSRVSSQYDTAQTTLYGKVQCALDYISGMTDLYALDLYRRLTGMNLPAV